MTVYLYSMLTLYRKFNYRHVSFSLEANGERIGVLTANGIEFVPYLGMISRWAARCLQGVPVVVELHAYSSDNGLGEWTMLPEGYGVWGCRLPGGVSVLVDGGFPVLAKYIRASVS